MRSIGDEMRNGKTKIAGMLLFCGMWSIVLVVSLPIIYTMAMSGVGLFRMVPVLVPMGFGLEWALSPVLTVSLLMISSEG